MITIRNRKMIVPANERHLCVEGDNNTCVREFSISREEKDLTGLSFFVDLLYEDGQKNENIILDPITRDEDMLLTWNVIANDIPNAGTVLIQLKAIDLSGIVKWKSYMEPFYIEGSIATGEDYSGSLSTYEVLAARMEQIASSEGTRETAETARLTAEELRATAEAIRISAELARQTAETLRQTNTTAVIQSANEKISDVESRFNTLTTEQQQDAEVIDARKGKASLKLKMDDIDSQLAEIENLNGFITTKKAGFSKTDGLGNMIMLVELINRGCGIKVEDMYPLDFAYDMEYVKDIRIVGVDKYSCGFVLRGVDGYDKSLTSTVDGLSIYIDNITLTTSVNSNNSVIFINHSANKQPLVMKNFDFTNNVVSNGVRVFRYVGDPLYDEYETYPGIERVNISNNVFENSYSYLFNFTDIPYKEFIVRDNRLHNLNQVFVYCATNNSNNQGSIIRGKRKLLVVEGNTLKNDDDFWCEGTDVYHCMILSEGYKTVYNNNHVEGLHSNRIGSPLYDCYLSDDIVVYTNNTWINNLNLCEEESFPGNLNTFLKMKGVTNSERYIFNNTFIAEREYAERVGVNENLIRVKMWSNMVSNYWWVKGNIFNAHLLMGDPSSSNRKFLEFSNNSINAYDGVNMVMCVTNEGAEMIFNNNTINIETGKFEFAITNMSTEWLGSMEITNNVIKANMPYFHRTRLRKLLFNNNIITLKDANCSLFFGELNEGNGYNNLIICGDNKIIDMIPLNAGSMNLGVKYLVETYQSDNSYQRGIDKFSTEGKHYHTVKVCYEGIEYTGCFSYNIAQREENFYLEYVDDEDIEQSVIITDLTSNPFDGTTVSTIKMIGDLAELVNFRIKYVAPSTLNIERVVPNILKHVEVETRHIVYPLS